MDFNTLLKEERQDILRIAAQHGVRDIRVLGSVARGDAGPDNDLNLLVELEPGRSLMDPGHLLMDLQDLLQCLPQCQSGCGHRERTPTGISETKYSRKRCSYERQPPEISIQC